MSHFDLLERDRLHKQLGERDERLRQLEQQLARQSETWESDARDWQRLQRHRRDLAEWLIDAATNEYGRITKPNIDAGLGGELFIPCTFSDIANGKRYQLALVSTEYSVQEV